VPKICTGIPPAGKPMPGHTRSIVVSPAAAVISMNYFSVVAPSSARPPHNS
jgi:hypothetical protein